MSQRRQLLVVCLLAALSGCSAPFHVRARQTLLAAESGAIAAESVWIGVYRAAGDQCLTEAVKIPPGIPRVERLNACIAPWDARMDSAIKVRDDLHAAQESALAALSLYELCAVEKQCIGNPPDMAKVSAAIGRVLELVAKLRVFYDQITGGAAGAQSAGGASPLPAATERHAPPAAPPVSSPDGGTR